MVTETSETKTKNFIQSWEPNLLTVVCTIIGIVVGGIFGHLLDDPTVYVRRIVYEWFYHTDEHLREGIRLRNEALAASTQTADSLHRQASSEFRLAANGGSAIAKAYLGQAYCYGWGVVRDRPKGLELIRQGWKDDNTLQEWISNPMYCHE